MPLPTSQQIDLAVPPAGEPNRSLLNAALKNILSSLAAVASSGSYTDLLNKPSLFSGAYTDLSGKPALFSGAYSDLSGKPVLFSGSYTDLTNKPTIPSRAPAVRGIVSAATVTPTFDDDQIEITAQAAALTLANPTGTAIPALGMVVRIKDSGVARAIAYGNQYRAVGVTLPVTTVAGKTLYLGMIYNAADTTWDVTAVAQQA